VIQPRGTFWDEWPVSPDGHWLVKPRFHPGDGVLIEHLDGTQRRLVTGKICCFILRLFAFDWAG
jgi:hypothetical protein